MFTISFDFVFYCDAKHSDILRGSSQVCCYLFCMNLGNESRENRGGTAINRRYSFQGRYAGQFCFCRYEGLCPATQQKSTAVAFH